MPYVTPAALALLALIAFAPPSFAQPGSNRVVCFTIGEAQEILDTLDVGNENKGTIIIQRSQLAEIAVQLDSYEREVMKWQLKDRAKQGVIEEKDEQIAALTADISKKDRKLKNRGFIGWIKALVGLGGGYYLGNRYPIPR